MPIAAFTSPPTTNSGPLISAGPALRWRMRRSSAISKFSRIMSPHASFLMSQWRKRSIASNIIFFPLALGFRTRGQTILWVGGAWALLARGREAIPNSDRRTLDLLNEREVCVRVGAATLLRRPHAKCSEQSFDSGINVIVAHAHLLRCKNPASGLSGDGAVKLEAEAGLRRSTYHRLAKLMRLDDDLRYSAFLLGKATATELNRSCSSAVELPISGPSRCNRYTLRPSSRSLRRCLELLRRILHSPPLALRCQASATHCLGTPVHRVTDTLLPPMRRMGNS